MPKLPQHLKTTRKFLGFKGNPAVHYLLDGGNLPKKLRLTYHRSTHNPYFIEQIIKPLGEEAELEAWLHLFQDWGLV